MAFLKNRVRVGGGHALNCLSAGGTALCIVYIYTRRAQPSCGPVGWGCANERGDGKLCVCKCRRCVSPAESFRVSFGLFHIAESLAVVGPNGPCGGPPGTSTVCSIMKSAAAVLVKRATLPILPNCVHWLRRCLGKICVSSTKRLRSATKSATAASLQRSQVGYCEILKVRSGTDLNATLKLLPRAKYLTSSGKFSRSHRRGTRVRDGAAPPSPSNFSPGANADGGGNGPGDSHFLTHARAAIKVTAVRMTWTELPMLR